MAMLGNITLGDYLAGTRTVEQHRPWSRHVLDEAGWAAFTEQLAVSEWQILSIWADGVEVHAAIRGEESQHVAVVSTSARNGRFPSLSRARPAAIRLERALRDLHGLEPVGLADQRPWLDHGRWPLTHPLAPRSKAAPQSPPDYAFLPAEGQGLHQIPVGPVHAGIIEPGQFRFTCAGETVVRLEERLGWVHKGVEQLMQNRPIADAARVMARLSGDSTVAYSLAFARAVEAATGIEAPERAHWVRAVMAEWERMANHVGDFGAVCNDAAFAVMLARCSALKERILRACKTAFGHRLMMDRVVPGGVEADLTREGYQTLRDLVPLVRKEFSLLLRLYEDTPSLQDRTVGTGIAASALVHRFGAGGFVARASSRSVDARTSPGYAPYDAFDLAVPVRPEGDVHARLMIRADEITASLDLMEQLLDRMPGGPAFRPVPHRPGEGMALVEGFRGEILVWLRLSEAGKVVRCHPRDPSWFQWPLLEAAIEGNIVADFPLCNKSFNCSYSGADL